MTLPYDRSHELTPQNKRYQQELERIVWHAFQSDTAQGDRTMELLSKWDQNSKAEIRSKASGILCGGRDLEWILKKKAPEIKVKQMHEEGSRFKKGEIVMTLEGKASILLKWERTLLNVLQRMCGIATMTAQFVNNAKPVQIAGTRKTLYGLLDKYAISIGGGLTHRLNLGDAIMIKNNHFALTQGKWEPIRNALEKNKKTVPFITIEIQKNQNLKKIVESLPSQRKETFFLLLDNWDAKSIKKALASCPKPKRVYFEASGGITEKNLRDYVQTGVDVLSIGALTHSTQAIDLSLKIQQ